MLLNGGINLVEAILVLVAGWLIANWIARAARVGLDQVPHFDPTLKPLITNLLRYGIFAFAIISVLNLFGVQTTSVIALLGAAGIAIGLALQGTLSNVASGVMLLLLRPLRVGEAVTIGDNKGRVREVGLFRSIIVTDDGCFVSIPNAIIFSGSVINTSREPTRRIGFPVTLDMSADIAEAQETILDTVRGDPRVLKIPAPTVEVSALNEFTYTLNVMAWTKIADFGPTKSDLQFDIRQKFQSAPVAAPQRLVGVAGKRKTAGDKPTALPASQRSH
jgi:small conductance mechanosensitive channel